MKHSLLPILLCLLTGLLFAQSADWEIIQSPQEPLIYSREHLYFINQNEGWLVGTISSVSTVLHTTDGGTTWTVQYNDSTDFIMYDVFFVDSNVGWIVGSEGTIWYTSDGGDNWTDQTPGTTSESLKGIYALDQNLVYVCGNDSTLLKTTDGGSNWQLLTSGSGTKPDLVDIYAFDANNVYTVSTSNDGVIMYTSDGGANWTTTYAPFPPTGLSQRQYACTGLPNGTAYSVGYHGTVFKSTDFGHTWSNVANLFGSLYKIFYSIDVYNDHIWVGGSDGKLFHSGNGGASWDTLHFPTTNNLKFIKAFDQNNLYAFSTYAQFFQSNNGGQDWTPILSWPNLIFQTLGAATTDKIFAGTSPGGEITTSNDGGYNWSYPLTPTNEAIGGITDFFFVDQNLGFYSGKNAQIGKTTDGGQTWTLKPNSQFSYGTTKSYYFVWFKDAQNGLVGGSSGIIQTTTDGGETWTEGSVGASATLYDCIFLDANTGIISASSGRIYKTTDGGTTWTEVIDFGTMAMNSIAFIDNNTGFIVADKGYVYKTTDGGDNWTQVTQLSNSNSPGDDPNLFKIEFVNATTGYICGEDGAIYKTTDGGTTWTQQNVPSEVIHRTLKAMVWTSETVGFIGSENGYIIGSGISGISSYPPVTQNFQLDQNYPNPFNPTTTIGFNLPASQKVEIVIYNNLGQVVRRLYNGKPTAGYHTLVWDGRNDFGLASPSGVYFYKLKAGKYTAVKKMVLMR